LLFLFCGTQFFFKTGILINDANWVHVQPHCELDSGYRYVCSDRVPLIRVLRCLVR